MSRYVPSLRVIELEKEDESLMPHHFAHARRAWAKQEEVLDNAYTYSVDEEKQGVWGGSPGVPKRDYFWPKSILEKGSG